MQPIVVNNIKSFELPVTLGTRRIYFPADTYTGKLFTLSVVNYCGGYTQPERIYRSHRYFYPEPNVLDGIYITLVDTDNREVLRDFPIEMLKDIYPVDYLRIDKEINWQSSYISIYHTPDSTVPTTLDYAFLFHFYEGEESPNATLPTSIYSIPIQNPRESGYNGSLSMFPQSPPLDLVVKQITASIDNMIFPLNRTVLDLYTREGNTYERLYLFGMSMFTRVTGSCCLDGWDVNYSNLNKLLLPNVTIDADRTVLSMDKYVAGGRNAFCNINFHY